MMRLIRDIISMFVIVFIFPATFGAFLLHEKFKQEAYIENNLSKLKKALIDQRVWVALGCLADIIKFILIIKS